MKKSLYILTTLFFLFTACNQTTNNEGLKTIETKDTIAKKSDSTYIVNPLLDAYPDASKLFKKYKNTNFYSTTFADDRKVGYIEFEYIKRSDTIIMIKPELLSEFLDLFSSNPKSFPDIYNNLNREFRSEADSNSTNVVLTRTNYRTLSVITDREVTHGVKEIIWQITNSGYNLGGTCRINLVFNYKPKDNSAKEFQLIYLSSFIEDCDM